MSDPVLWPRADHTAAKHQVLRSYLDAWIPVMGHQALRARNQGFAREEPRLLLVDGFAGPGIYSGGEPGSPLIMLRALLDHRDFARLGDVAFLFLFIEQDVRRAARLTQEIAGLGALPHNVRVSIEPEPYEQVFSSLITGIHEGGGILVPTFAFVDPFGYSDSSMSLTGRLLDFPRCEALIFLPLSAVSRFVGRAGQEIALDALFGCDDWRGAVALHGAERGAFLIDLFERQVGKGRYVQHVRSFQLRTRDGQDYRLVFGLGHPRGLEIAKAAMWKAAPSPAPATPPRVFPARRSSSRRMSTRDRCSTTFGLPSATVPSRSSRRTRGPSRRTSRAPT